MTGFTFESDHILVDVEATRDYYARYGQIAGGCTCAACRNFADAIGAVPGKVGETLARLGLDLRKPIEVCEWGRETDGHIWYSAWYHLVGTQLTEGTEQITFSEGCKLSFQSECFILQEEFPSPHFQLNLELHLPWVLKEPYE